MLRRRGEGEGEGVEQLIRKAKLQTAAPSKNVVLMVLSSLNKLRHPWPRQVTVCADLSLMCSSSEKPGIFRLAGCVNR